jgi:hypothetical protein
MRSWEAACDCTCDLACDVEGSSHVVEQLSINYYFVLRIKVNFTKNMSDSTCAFHPTANSMLFSGIQVSHLYSPPQPEIIVNNTNSNKGKHYISICHLHA